MKWNLAVALGAFLSVASSVPGTASPQAGNAAETKSHGFAERRVAFEDTWQRAGEEDRDRLRSEIRRYRNVGLSALRQVDSARLVRWTRMLSGHEISRLPSDLENWMGNVEVRVIPGWMLKEVAQANPQVLALVLAPSQPPFPPKAGEHAQFRLHWVNDKGERTLARAAQVTAADFGTRGFEVFLNSPGAAGGHWRLEPSLELGDKTVWGHPVGFYLPSVLPELQGAGARAGKAMLRLQESGFRDQRWGGLGSMFAGAPASNLKESSSGGPRSLTLPASSQGKQAARALVWVVVPGARLLEGEFIGKRGEAWRALAAKGVTIVASHAPLVGSKEALISASSAMIQETKDLSGIPRILVVRGNLARGLGVGSKKAFDGFDALVLQNPRNRNMAPRAPFGEAPTLFLLPSDPWKGPTVPGTQRAVASMDPPAVMSMDTARYIGQYLDFLAPKKDETGASGTEDL